MAYLPGYEHDILISYAHLNNPQGKGWVARFHERLEAELKQLVGRDLNIWRDLQLARNQLFDLTIKQAVEQSGLFLAINSWIVQRQGQQTRFQSLVREQAERERDAIEATADGLYRAGNNQFEGAISKFNEAIAKQGDYAPAYFYRGIAQARLGENAKALADFEKTLTLPVDEKLRDDAEDLIRSLRAPSAPGRYDDPTVAEERTQLINEMFNDDRATRIAATTALILEWKQDPKLIPAAIAAARERRKNADGVINTLVLLESLDVQALRERRDEINALLDVLSSANPGPQTTLHIRNVREILRN